MSPLINPIETGTKYLSFLRLWVAECVILHVFLNQHQIWRTWNCSLGSNRRWQWLHYLIMSSTSVKPSSFRATRWEVHWKLASCFQSSISKLNSVICRSQAPAISDKDKRNMTDGTHFEIMLIRRETKTTFFFVWFAVQGRVGGHDLSLNENHTANRSITDMTLFLLTFWRTSSRNQYHIHHMLDLRTTISNCHHLICVPKTTTCFGNIDRLPLKWLWSRPSHDIVFLGWRPFVFSLFSSLWFDFFLSNHIRCDLFLLFNSSQHWKYDSSKPCILFPLLVYIT